MAFERSAKPPDDGSHASDPSAGGLPAPRRAQRKGLAEEVAEQLLELIASSSSAEVRLPPERMLCEQFGVSRNPLREALVALEQMGILETRGKTRVGLSPRARARQITKLPTPATLSARDLLIDPIEVRRIVEPEAAALAAKRATDQSVRDMERWLELMDAAIQEGRSVSEYDSGFHVAVAQATMNAILIQLVDGLTEALQPSRAESFRPTEAASQALKDHRAILAAIRDADARGARRAMRSHLDHVQSLIRSSISGSPGTD